MRRHGRVVVRPELRFVRRADGARGVATAGRAVTGDGCASLAVVPRAPEPRGERAEVARAERRARQTHGAHERERSWYVRIAWEETVRKRVSGRRGRRDEERTSSDVGRSGEISETSDNTHEAHDGDRRACALRDNRLRRRTFGSRRPLLSSLKSCVRACAPAAKTATRHPRARSREAPSPRERASVSHPSRGKTSAALEGAGMATARTPDRRYPRSVRRRG
jgi:hypothetical protein